MTAHRYWRIYITHLVQDAYYPSFSEIELRNTPGGPDLTGSGTAFASYEPAGSPAWMAVDNNISTSWGTDAGRVVPQWWAYDFGLGNAFDIVEITVQAHQSSGDPSPKDFSWQYSDDGINWTTQREYLNQTGWGGWAIKTFDVSLPPTLNSVSPEMGSLVGGLNVTLTGTNLTGITGVTFGGDNLAATNVTVVNDTTVTCTTPAHAAGVVDVVAVRTQTATAVLASGFAYLPISLITAAQERNFQEGFDSKVMVRRFFGHFGHH